MPLSFAPNTNNKTTNQTQKKRSPSPPSGKRKIGSTHGPAQGHNKGSRKTQRIGGNAPYHITKYTYRQAKKYGVKVKQSTKKDKKIDVFDKSGHKLVSVGARGMNDFPTFAKKFGWPYARTRRRLYRMRHERDRHRKGTKGWYADKLLW